MADKTDAQRLEDAEAAANTYLNENRKLQERVENFESTRRNAAEQRAKALEEQDKTDRQRATERALLVKLEDLERDNQRQRLLATLAEQALESAPDAQGCDVEDCPINELADLAKRKLDRINEEIAKLEEDDVG